MVGWRDWPLTTIELYGPGTSRVDLVREESPQ